MIVESPCVKICRLENGVCIGCKRTREEVAKWARFTDAEKLQVLQRLKDLTTKD